MILSNACDFSPDISRVIKAPMDLCEILSISSI